MHNSRNNKFVCSQPVWKCRFALFVLQTGVLIGVLCACAPKKLASLEFCMLLAAAIWCVFFYMWFDHLFGVYFDIDLTLNVSWGNVSWWTVYNKETVELWGLVHWWCWQTKYIGMGSMWNSGNPIAHAESSTSKALPALLALHIETTTSWGCDMGVKWYQETILDKHFPPYKLEWFDLLAINSKTAAVKPNHVYPCMHLLMSQMYSWPLARWTRCSDGSACALYLHIYPYTQLHKTTEHDTWQTEDTMGVLIVPNALIVSNWRHNGCTEGHC